VTIKALPVDTARQILDLQQKRADALEEWSAAIILERATERRFWSIDADLEHILGQLGDGKVSKDA
jgi:hypothetical protein